MKASQTLTIYLKNGCLLLCLSLMMTVYSCQSEQSSAKTKSNTPVAKAKQSNADTVVKFVKGPGFAKASCCKGTPSRARAMAARNK